MSAYDLIDVRFRNRLNEIVRRSERFTLSYWGVIALVPSQDMMYAFDRCILME